MPLSIDTTQCKGQDPVLNRAVAFAMYNCGVQHLKTQDDADELFIRYRMMHIALNTLSTEDLLTYAQISKFVGATSNASKKTPTQFNKDITTHLRDAALTIMRRHKEKDMSNAS